MLAVITSCGGPDRTKVLAQYLMEVKRLRDDGLSGIALQDSIKTMESAFGIDPEDEIAKLSENPYEWVKLLKDLKRGR